MAETITLFTSFITVNVWIVILFIRGVKDLKSVRFKKKRIRLYWLFIVTFFAGMSVANLVILNTSP